MKKYVIMIVVSLIAIACSLLVIFSSVWQKEIDSTENIKTVDNFTVEIPKREGDGSIVSYELIEDQGTFSYNKK